MYAQCTECTRSFPVTASQIQERHGFLYCVHCEHGFNAIPTLSDEPVEYSAAQQVNTPPWEIEGIGGGHDPFFPKPAQPPETLRPVKPIPTEDDHDTGHQAPASAPTLTPALTPAPTATPAPTPSPSPAPSPPSSLDPEPAPPSATAATAEANLDKLVRTTHSDRELLELTNPAIAWQGRRKWKVRHRTRRHRFFRALFWLLLLATPIGGAVWLVQSPIYFALPEALTNIKALHPLLEWICERAPCTAPGVFH